MILRFSYIILFPDPPKWFGRALNRLNALWLTLTDLILDLLHFIRNLFIYLLNRNILLLFFLLNLLFLLFIFPPILPVQNTFDCGHPLHDQVSLAKSIWIIFQLLEADSWHLEQSLSAEVDVPAAAGPAVQQRRDVALPVGEQVAQPEETQAVKDCDEQDYEVGDHVDHD